MTGRLATLLGWLLAASVLVIALGHVRSWYRQPPLDFGAFYSAGKVVLEHRDPYRTEPLLRAEREVAGPNNQPTAVVPVPLPGYDLAGLSLLARLPPHAATMVFVLLTLAGLGAIAYALAAMSPLPLPLAFVAAFYGATYVASTLGQLAPLAIGAIGLAAVCVRKDKPIAASACLGVALMQPQLAIPAILSCLAFVPRMRAALAAIIVLAFAASLQLGIASVPEYLKVLALQARAELTYPAQYSLSWILNRAGLSDGVALGLGTLSSVVGLVAALAILARYRGRTVMSEAVVLLPPALAVCGGTYIHEYQMQVALLAALILARKAQWGLDASFAAGLFLIPFFLLASTEPHWPHLSTLPSIVLGFASAWAITFHLADARTIRERIRIASTHTCIFAAYFLALAFTRPPFDRLSHLTFAAPVSPARGFASENWRLTVLAQGGHVNELAWIVFVKLPTWFAVIFTILSAVHTLAESSLRDPSAGSPDVGKELHAERARTTSV